MHIPTHLSKSVLRLSCAPLGILCTGGKSAEVQQFCMQSRLQNEARIEQVCE